MCITRDRRRLDGRDGVVRSYDSECMAASADDKEEEKYEGFFKSRDGSEVIYGILPQPQPHSGADHEYFETKQHLERDDTIEL